MKKFVLAAGAMAGVALLASNSPASARDYPVCVQGLYRAGGEGDSIRCEYDNFAQCRAAVLGMAGTCFVNPLYPAGTTDTEPRVRQRRH